MATLPDLPQTEIAIVEMTNALRKQSKLGEVKPNAALTAAARAFAGYLAKTGKFGHDFTFSSRFISTVASMPVTSSVESPAANE